ncbi:MAG: hypothetical protein V3R80_06795, partial [Candidatus Tectomicrobia bacterium]
MTGLRHSDRTELMGLWLNPEQVETSIEPLLLRMLEPSQPDLTLRQSVLEELSRRVKRKDVVLQYLGLRQVGTDPGDDVTLHVASPDQEKNPWQEALLLHQGDCPIGFVLNTWDAGRVVVVHEVFRQLTSPQQELVRKYAALAAQGTQHDRIVTMLSRADAVDGRYRKTILEARRRIQILDQSILFSRDSEIRVQVGSLSQTTKNILREGLTGHYLFILPQHLFDGKTNYA